MLLPYAEKREAYRGATTMLGRQACGLPTLMAGELGSIPKKSGWNKLDFTPPEPRL